MKKVGFLVLVLCFCLNTMSYALDSYWVILIKGGVSSIEMNKTLKLGDKIGTTSKLKFMSKDSYIVVMGPKGKFTIKPEVKSASQNEFFAFVNSALLPVSSRGRLSTRGEESTGVSNLADYFGEDKFALIGANYGIALNASKYQLSDSKFLIYRYECNGEVVSKKIAFEGSKLIFEQGSLYTDAHGNSLDPEKIEKVDLYKYDKDTKSSTKIVTFKPFFIDETQLKEELVALSKICKEELGMDESITKEELVKFVVDLYGRIDEVYLTKWLDENIVVE